MDKTEAEKRLEAIAFYAQREQERLERAEQEKWNTFLYLNDKFRELWPRFNDLIKIAQSCIDHGIDIKKFSKDGGIFSSLYFEINKGKVYLPLPCPETSHFTLYIGQHGLCLQNGTNVMCMTDTVNVRSYIGVMRDSLTALDTFESKFYAYVDKMVC